jgi:flagellar biosynthesis protein FlhB
VVRVGEPSFEPTPRRLEEARRAGQVAHSRRLTGAAALAAAFVAVTLAAPAAAVELTGYLREALRAAVAAGGPGAAAGPGPALAGAARELARLLALPLGAAVAAALVVGLAQTRGLIALGPLRPDLGRLAPGAGWRRLWGGRAAGEAGRGLVELAVAGALALALVRPAGGAIAALAGAPPAAALAALGTLARRLAGGVVAAALALGALDYVLVRRRHLLALRMTRDERRRELRETEGDPLQRAERRRLHRELARTTPGSTMETP